MCRAVEPCVVTSLERCWFQQVNIIRVYSICESHDIVLQALQSLAVVWTLKRDSGLCEASTRSLFSSFKNHLRLHEMRSLCLQRDAGNNRASMWGMSELKLKWQTYERLDEGQTAAAAENRLPSSFSDRLTLRAAGLWLCGHGFENQRKFIEGCRASSSSSYCDKYSPDW